MHTLNFISQHPVQIVLFITLILCWFWIKKDIYWVMKYSRQIKEGRIGRIVNETDHEKELRRKSVEIYNLELKIKELTRIHGPSGNRITIDLNEISGVGLIIEQETGIKWHNTIGGYACAWGRAEGVFIPIAGETLFRELDNYFFGGAGTKWQGHCYAGIDQETADFINKLFGEFDEFRRFNLMVDQDRLSEAKEAWIPVTLQSKIEGVDSSRGILTWKNSD